MQPLPPAVVLALGLTGVAGCGAFEDTVIPCLSKPLDTDRVQQVDTGTKPPADTDTKAKRVRDAGKLLDRDTPMDVCLSIAPPDPPPAPVEPHPEPAAPDGGARAPTPRGEAVQAVLDRGVLPADVATLLREA